MERHHLKSSDAAKRIGVATNTLRAWRRDGKGPRYFRATRTSVYYREEDVERFLEDRERRAQETGDGVRED